MRIKACIFVLCSVAASNVFADWSLLTSDDNKKTHFYADLDSVRPVGSYLRLWVMTDYAAPELPKGASVAYSSSRQLMEFDCSGQQLRTLAISNSDKNMGGGNVVSSDMNISKPSDWTPSIPGSFGATWMEDICTFRPYLSKPKQWLPIGKSGDVTLYYDRASFKRAGDVASLRTMYDRATPVADVVGSDRLYYSQVFTADYDCNAQTFRSLSVVSYSRPKGEGKVISMSLGPPTDWQAILPEGIMDKQMTMACSLK